MLWKGGGRDDRRDSDGVAAAAARRWQDVEGSARDI